MPDERFRKCVRILDSSNPGERNAALTLVWQQCGELGMTVYEGIVKEFGDNQTVAELQELVKQREADGAFLVDKVMDLERQLKEAMAVRGQCEMEHDLGELIGHAWQFPQTRLIAVACVIILRLTICWEWADWHSQMAFWTANAVLLGAAVLWLCQWARLQFGLQGLIQLLIKSAIFLGAVTAGFYLVAGVFPWEFGFDISRWLGHRLHSPAHGFVLIAAGAVVAVSKLSDWLQNTVGKTVWESSPMQTVRGCF
jgi:hypothetical protein